MATTTDLLTLKDVIAAGLGDNKDFLAKFFNMHCCVLEIRESIENNDLENIKLYKSSGYDIHRDNDNFLRSASSQGKLEIVKFLVEDGGDIHIFGNNCFNNAASNGHLEVVKYLFEKGAIDETYESDEACKLAAYYGRLEVVQFLFEKGIFDIKDEVILVWACDCSSTIEVVKYLVANGAEFNLSKFHRTSNKVKEYLTTLNKVSYYGISLKDKLEIKLPELHEIIKNDKYYYVYKCTFIDDGYILADIDKKNNLLSSFGQVKFFHTI